MWLLLTRTRLGLFVRGVTQNRAMASCVGVPTARVDTWAFGLGSGIAGLAGCALSQIGNVGPDLGQSYIVDSFMVVVLGGVGQLAGTVYAALGLGIANKFLEAWSGAVLAKIAVLVFIIVFIQKRPQGLFALKGRMADATRWDRWPPASAAAVRPQGLGRARRVAAIAVRAVPVACSGAQGQPFHLSDYTVALVGKIMCYAIVALAMDLIWGYTGILSLGHGLFFALGGYAMGMYLMRQIGHDGQYQSDLPDFMVFLDWKAYPWYWSFTDHFWFAALLVVLVPGLLAFVFGYFAFRSRIKGVYFSIITQALTFRVDAAVLPQRHRLRRQQRLHRLQAHPRLSHRHLATRMALFAITGARICSGTLLFARHRHLQARPGADRHPRRRERASCSPATTRCITSFSSGRCRP